MILAAPTENQFWKLRKDLSEDGRKQASSRQNQEYVSLKAKIEPWEDAIDLVEGMKEQLSRANDTKRQYAI